MTKEFQLLNVPVRFFIYKEMEIPTFDDSPFDVVECGEGEFEESNYPISYERHTVFQNGVSQICLTKMPES